MKLSFNSLSSTNLIDQCLDFCFQNHCVLCDESCRGDIALCADCHAELPKVPNPCRQCGISLPVDDLLCGPCLKSPPPYRKLISAFAYHDVLPHMMSQYKFQQRLLFADIFADALYNEIRNHYSKTTLPELIIPMPLHKKRLRERGFNQAHEVAKILSRRLSIPTNTRHIQRIKATQAQTLVKRKERAQNVKNAFVADINANHVAIVDDVVTTGATVAALCQALKASSVTTIDVWCVSRPLFN